MYRKYKQAMMDELVELVRGHQKAYYEGKPTISDEIFDALLLFLKLEEKRYPSFVRSGSPTQEVGH